MCTEMVCAHSKSAFPANLIRRSNRLPHLRSRCRISFPSTNPLLNFQCLDIRRRALGPTHLDTLATARSLADCHHRCGTAAALRRALSLYEEYLLAVTRRHANNGSTSGSDGTCGGEGPCSSGDDSGAGGAASGVEEQVSAEVADAELCLEEVRRDLWALECVETQAV